MKENPLDSDITSQTQFIHGKEWKTKSEIANYYKCCKRTINNLMERRILPFIKIGRFVRFDVKECDRVMDKYKIGSMLDRH